MASPSGRGRRASSRAGEGSATPVRALTRASTVQQKPRPGAASCRARPRMHSFNRYPPLRCPARTRYVPRHDLFRHRFEDRGVSALEIDRVAHHDIGGAAARGHFLESCRQIVGFDLIKGEIFVRLLVVAHLRVGQAKALRAYESRYVQYVGDMLLVVPFVVFGFFAGNRVGQHYKCISWHCHSPLFDWASAATPVTPIRTGRYKADCNALRGQLSNLIQKSSSRVVGHFNEPTASLSCHSTSLKLFRFLPDVHFRSLSLSRERARV